MKLYSYWRSTTSYRVRAALNLKGLAYQTVPVDLVAGDQRNPDYRGMNPGAGVPTLVLEDGTALTQSMAILDYLDSVAAPRLLPDAPLARAKVMAAAHTVALDIHPVNNLRVVQHLAAAHGADAEAKRDWMLHWMQEGFAALEAQIDGTATFCFGDAPDLADLCLVSQMYNARRWGLDMTPFPNITRVEAACLEHPAIAAAHPDTQPDAKDAT